MVPKNPRANPDNLEDVYVVPGRPYVMMIFPAAASSTGVRQDFIEIDETPWQGGNPHEAFLNDIAAYPDIGKHICDIQGIEALCVTPNSPSDAAGANPAYVRIIIAGVDIEIYGGNDLDALKEIAATLGRG